MNVSSIKTPGVYINEIDAFPPSVAQVATAIPAFIGYTDKGPKVPTRIKSFMEFEQTFGGAPTPKKVTVYLDENNIPKETCAVEESQYKLYNSMKLFYANGGGVCYIVSIGSYKTAITSEVPFITGLNSLKKFDEPTLILFPDAVNLDFAKLGLLHQQALQQCADLMDRFTVMDVKYHSDSTEDPPKLETDCGNFRDKVANENLKYGSAYYPYLQCAFPYEFRFSDINGDTAGKVNFKVIFSTNSVLKQSIENYEKLINDYNAINTAWNPDPVPLDASNPKKLHEAITDGAKLNTAVDKCWELLETLGKPDAPDITSVKFSTSLKDKISITLKKYAQDLVDFKFSYENLKKADNTDVDPLSGLDNDSKFKSVWGNISNYTETSPDNPYDDKIKVSIPADAGPPAIPAHDEPDFVKIQMVIQKLHTDIISKIDSIMKQMYDLMMFEENNLVVQIPFYQSIIEKLSSYMNTVPPSGAIVGIYAKTDATRGVWKSPANVSVNGIIGLTADINDADQADMNIHETGKSVNPIRNFSGKGFLVWGGRTLAGNSNDWRYINVRRLANMIEESVKKACMQYVFEPNVSQTWVSVKGMIDNYLTTLWNDGALAGSKAEHAFFVSVGLNETMSAQDILEGRMIVKIGYAPSRPAEFIILEFKQMQQRS